MSRPDDHISEQIREKLDAYRPAYNPAAWKRLEARLENHSSSNPDYRVRTWLFGFLSGLIISLLGGVLIFNYLNPKEDNVEIYKELNALKLELKSLKKNQEIIEIYKERPSQKSINVSQELAFDLKKPTINYQGNLLLEEIYDSENENAHVGNSSMPLLVLESDLSYLPLISSHSNNEIGLMEVKRIDSIIHKDKIRKKFKFKWPQFNFPKGEGLYRNFVGPDKVSLLYEPGIEFGNHQDKIGFSQSCGIGISGKLSDKMKLSLGINFGQYSWSQQKEIGHIENNIVDSLTTSQWIVDSLVLKKGNWQYFDVPITFSYKIMDFNKSHLFLNAGITARFYTKERYIRRVQIDNLTEEDVINYSPFTHNYFPARISLGLSYGYQFNQRWSITATPTYSFNIMKLGAQGIKNSAFNLGIQLNYKFRKEN